MSVFQRRSYFVDGRGTKGVENVGSVEGYACAVIGCGDVVGNVLEFVGEVDVIVNRVRWDDVESVAEGSGRCCF